MLKALRHPGENTLVFLLGVVQFIMIINFMMMMPLGPDFGKALDIPMADLGWIGGSYTFAAAISGVIGAVYLDRFDRKKALLASLSGLMLMTFISGMAWDFTSLLVTRFFTGVVCGPGGAVCFAIVADAIPAERRGKAMGKIMGAFSFASVIGVPFGLELSRLWGWRSPFFFVSVSTAIILVLLWHTLPSMRGHISEGARVRGFSVLKDMLLEPVQAMAFLFVGLGTFATFLFIPNLAGYAQYNLHFPREYLGMMYMAGGGVSFFILRVMGDLADRTRITFVGIVGGVLLCTVFLFGFIDPIIHSVPLIYILFMVGASTRNMANQTLTTRIPKAQQRAGFLAMVSCFSQFFAAFGAFCASIILSEAEGKKLVGMEHVAGIASVLVLIVPFMMAWVEMHVRRREKEALLLPAEMGSA